jgi:septal ring factor EnvC (AmiA/AmiB activator)
MTTRDDLMSELRKIEARLMASNETKADAWDIGLAIEQLTASATALEAKDAEIARLTAANSELDEKWRYWQSRADTNESRISDLERQLAKETERCAKFRALLVRVNALAQTPAWKRMPDGGLFSSTPLAGDIAAALAQSKEK